jgi:branched-chain amino acid transport system ATP-binding protein
VSALLETRELSRRFGGLQALADVSLEVDSGQVLGIIGPNGAGKTTLINLMTGYVAPSSGKVLIAGKDMTGRKPWVVAHAGVARTFQIVKPFRAMTVRENVAMGAMYGPKKADSLSESLGRADEVLDRVGLAPKTESRPDELTVADRKRLELAKALAMRPKLLLLDEVMAGLRPNEVDESVELIRSLKAEGMAIAAIEHVMKAIMAISDQVLVLYEGKKLTQGSPDDVAGDERVIEAYLGERFARRQRGDDGDEGA